MTHASRLVVARRLHPRRCRLRRPQFSAQDSSFSGSIAPPLCAAFRLRGVSDVRSMATRAAAKSARGGKGDKADKAVDAADTLGDKRVRDGVIGSAACAVFGGVCRPYEWAH